MRGLQKSKRVSWPSDVNLCQVRLFLSEESPSQVGLGAQDHLQAKSSWPPHSTGMSSDDNLPPGFEGACPANTLKNNLSQIPIIKWRCPLRFVLDPTWQVVAGEESKDLGIQNQREMRVLEAVYPRASAIPPNPSVLIGLEGHQQNDHQIPLIPITPIEEEDTSGDASFNSMAPNTINTSSQPPQLAPGILPASQSGAKYPHPPANRNQAAGMVPGVEPDVAVAAYAALSSVLTSNNQGNLIDQDLLIKVLSDPKMIEKLVTDHRAVTNPQNIPKPSSPGITLPEPPPVPINRTETGLTSLPATSSAAPFYPPPPPPNRVGPTPNHQWPPPEAVPVPSPPVGASMAKDINYYKSLIQQHGGEGQGVHPQIDNYRGNHHKLVAAPEISNYPKPKDSKPKIMKPCMFFNSSKGCRHGANCLYQHNASPLQPVSGMPEVQGAKRMKLDREITGT